MVVCCVLVILNLAISASLLYLTGKLKGEMLSSIERNFDLLTDRIRKTPIRKNQENPKVIGYEPEPDIRDAANEFVKRLEK